MLQMQGPHKRQESLWDPYPDCQRARLNDG
jgi:hypothetical protein